MLYFSSCAVSSDYKMLKGFISSPLPLSAVQRHWFLLLFVCEIPKFSVEGQNCSQNCNGPNVVDVGESVTYQGTIIIVNRSTREHASKEQKQLKGEKPQEGCV
jgi:hypothetical protein